MLRNNKKPAVPDPFADVDLSKLSAHHPTVGQPSNPFANIAPAKPSVSVVDFTISQY